MRRILLAAVFVFLLACSGGGGGEVPITSTKTPAIPEWVIKGDSMAYLLALQWEGSENNGVPGARIEDLAPDDRMLKKVVIMVGINNLACGRGQTAAETATKYSNYFRNIKAKKVYCVGVPKIDSEAVYGKNLLPTIQKLNAAIKDICGPSYYVDTWAISFTSKGGLHPDTTMNVLIRSKILELDK